MKKKNAVSLTPKSPSESSVEMTELVLPPHANALGTVFGGVVMSWIDVAAAIAAMRHARRAVVTASMDALHFLAPIRVGQIVRIHARVNYVSRTSMEVGVRVESEDQLTGEVLHVVKAYATFVALDESGQPTPISPLEPKTADEKRRYEQAIARRESRIKLAEKMKSGG